MRRDAALGHRKQWCLLIASIGCLSISANPLLGQREQGGASSAHVPTERSRAFGASGRIPLHAPVWALSAVARGQTVSSALSPYANVARETLPWPRTEQVVADDDGSVWPTVLRVSAGALTGAVIGKFAHDRACEGGRTCSIDHSAVSGWFGVLGALGGFLFWREDDRDGTAPDSSLVPDDAWLRMRAVPVPSTPPDSLPAWMYAPENVVPATPYVTEPFLRGIVLVAFRSWVTMEARQQAIDRIEGAVIGGEPAADGEGFHYVLVRDDASGRAVREAIIQLTAQRGVALAAPRYANHR